MISVLTNRSTPLTGTGVALPVELGFVPSRVELTNSEGSIIGFWDKSMRDGTFCIEHCAELRTGEILIGSHLPSIGTTDTSIAHGRVVTQHDAAGDVRVELAAAPAGIAIGGGTHDITADKWGCYRVMTPTGGGGAGVITIADTSLANDTEALAIANMGALSAQHADIGYVTVKTAAGAVFDADADGLAGGTTLNVASETNYYEGYGIMSTGITPKDQAARAAYLGFEIGVHALLNVVGSRLYYKAYRS